MDSDFKSNHSHPTPSKLSDIISNINSKLSMQIKSLGVINRFNGVDIAQTKDYINIYNKAYIRKILKDKNWLDATIPKNDNIAYTPMHHDLAFNKRIEDADPIPENELASIQKEMVFGYKQCI